MLRKDNRRADEIRPLRITYNIFDYADGSVLLEVGKTKVLCAVTLQSTVPSFLRGKRVGWLAAQYAMLPTSTQVRSERESFSRYNGRMVEISRMIGRSLRAIVDLSKLGERSITIDCDVIQADGGTRTACITGAYFALKQAMERWVASGEVSQNLLRDEIAAISVGLVDGQVLLDIDYDEDSKVQTDFNFALTRSGKIVEMQGSAEQSPMDWEHFELMKSMALQGIKAIFQQVEAQIQSQNQAKTSSDNNQQAAFKTATKQPTMQQQSPTNQLTFGAQRKKIDNSLKARLAAQNPEFFKTTVE